LPQDITVADVAAVATAAFVALLLIGHSCNTANSSWTSACADAHPIAQRGRQSVIEPAPHHRDDEDGAIASPFSGQAEQKQLQQQHHQPATPSTSNTSNHKVQLS